MLDIGWSELLVVAIVAVVVVGPKDLPKLMRTFGFYAGKVRRAAADFRRQFDEAMSESEAEDVRKNIEAIRANMGTATDFNQPIDKPLMTPMSEPAPKALGEYPQATGEHEPPTVRKPQSRSKRAAANKAGAKTAKTKTPSASSAKTAKSKSAAKRTTKSTAAKSNAKAPRSRNTKTGARSAAKTKRRPRRET